MLFLNQIVFICLFLLFQLGVVSAKTLEFHALCGEYKYIVTIDNPDEFYGTVIKHYFQEKNSKRKLFYQTEEDMLVEASCIKDKNNSDLFIFQEQCSGNACPENIYGLFDPKRRKLLLKPSDWPKGNEQEVMKIIGADRNNFDLNFDGFCCNDQLGQYRSEKNKRESMGSD